MLQILDILRHARFEDKRTCNVYEGMRRQEFVGEAELGLELVALQDYVAETGLKPLTIEGSYACDIEVDMILKAPPHPIVCRPRHRIFFPCRQQQSRYLYRPVCENDCLAAQAMGYRAPSVAESNAADPARFRIPQQIDYMSVQDDMKVAQFQNVIVKKHGKILLF
jgi:hypothetical protein